MDTGLALLNSSSINMEREKKNIYDSIRHGNVSGGTKTRNSVNVHVVPVARM